MKDLHILFGQNLKRIREEKGLTQEQLAERVNISLPYVSNIETGRKNPSLNLIERLAQGLMVSPIRLFAISELTGTDLDQILSLLAHVPTTKLKKIKASIQLMTG